MLGRIGQSRRVKTCGDLFGQQHFGIARVAPPIDLGLQSGDRCQTLKTQQGVPAPHQGVADGHDLGKHGVGIFGNANVVHQNDLQIDLLGKTVKFKNHPIELTKKEFDLLLYFIGNKNRVISKSTLAEHLSGDFADMLDNHDFVYAHIKNLKKKLNEAGCENYLKTVYGTGYKWEG